MHWKILRPVNKPLRYELQVAQIRHAVFQRAFVDYCKWREVKYRPTTAKCSRGELLIFFLWLQEHYPDVSCLSELTRPVALAFALYLKQQGEEGRSGPLYRHSVYSRARHFVDFAMKEWPDIAPLRNPFAADDLPPKPEMVPRYLDDRDIRAVLQYCEQEASLLERTMVITLLHTGIRACELAALKASDMVQVGGAWKLHIHEGKGLKDRLIPLTARCVEVRQAWQAQGWERVNDFLFTRFGRPWKNSNPVCERIAKLGSKLGIVELSPHRFRHTFAVALLNYGIRESALQKLMGHAEVGMTLEYARILDQTVERGFTEAVTHMQEGARSWIPNFFVQEECTLFAEGDAVSWIRLPMGYCRRNPKLHCESDVKCLLCDRFAIGGEDLPRLQQMYERFMKLGLKLKADVVAAQIRRLEAPSEERNGSQGFVPMHAISVSGKRR